MISAGANGVNGIDANCANSIGGCNGYSVEIGCDNCSARGGYGSGNGGFTVGGPNLVTDNYQVSLA